MTELKPCPFCGTALTNNRNKKPRFYHEDRYYFHPDTKECRNDCIIIDTEDELELNQWNTRPSLWTTITDEASLPKESDTGNYCFIHNIHNDVCYRALWQHHWKCWVVEHDINDKYYPIKDIDMWMLNPIPYPTESSKYATE